MRVKTVPRQRILHGSNHVEPVSVVIVGKSDRLSNNQNGKVKLEGARYPFDAKDDSYELKQSDESVESDEGRKEAMNYSTEALDMTIQRKLNSSQKDLPNGHFIVGPSSIEHSKLSIKEEPEETTVSDDNNNVLPSRPLLAKLLEDSKPCISDSASPTEAVNLCKKDHQDEDLSNLNTISSGKLKDTFLYKIMTDPTFLETIQKHKQPRKYSCQFCKQEFANEEELDDHMDIKKDESNQVICCACKKTFAQKRYLRYHQRCHSERTKFTCDICTKKYTRLDNLARHNAFHVNPDKFACTYCEKTFARKDLLNKHLKCHDNKHRFFCQECQKYFMGALALDSHKRINHAASVIRSGRDSLP
ncbi:uncharacterized protein LOC143213353 isoform X2 [Lasioglossum baleicum]|uniref:uncharacterized protein LOC143213353 isoform X2 n=1 Tax=Lasioglossum baleicum TaxID=434251 RepID=UPI003FCDE62C